MKVVNEEMVAAICVCSHTFLRVNEASDMNKL